jgi:D-alanine-D-alanine ligase
LQHIIKEGIYRHSLKQKKYTLKGNAIAGYGIYATQNIAVGEVIFKGEEMAQRIVTKRFVDNNWGVNEKLIFAKYAYPVSKEVYLLWDNNPAEWAPQNHSCNANTSYKGLNVVALLPIKKGDELTLNYASFLDETMEPFNCQCGSPNCSGLITGIKNNSVTERENKATN